MSEPSTVDTPSRMKTLIRRARSLLLLTVVVVVGVVVMQNTEQDHVRVLSMTIQMPKAGLLAGTLLTGFVLGLLWSQRFRK
ncbi:MAG: LapA family protein [Planctomycetota bacterium]|nr:LapA family protein [Planctomycetota bacterium]